MLHNASAVHARPHTPAALPSAVSAFSQRHIRALLHDTLVGRTDDAPSLEIEFLYAVCHPSHDARHGEYRGVNLLRQTYHLVYEARIEVHIGAERLLCLAPGGHTLDALLLEQPEEIILLVAPLLFGEFAGKPFQLHGTRVAHGIHGVSYAVDESAPVVGVAVEDAVKISVYLRDIGPVAYVLLQMVEHVDGSDVCASVQRTLERANAGCYARVSVGAARRRHPHRERGVVSTSVLRLYDEEHVEHPRVELGVVSLLQHVEEVLGYREVLMRVMDVQRASAHGVAVAVVGVSHDCGELRGELHRLAHEVVARQVVGVRVERVHLQHSAREYVHDVRTLKV